MFLLNYMNKEIILFGLIFILLFTFGCIAPVSQEGGYNETISEVYESDLNNDGLIDSATYVFQKQSYNKTNLQRVIIIKPKFDLSKIEAKIENTTIGDRYYFENLSISELKAYLDNFDKKRSNKAKVTGEAQCKQYLGLGREDLPCIDIQSCSQSCIGAPLCRSIYQFVGEPFTQDLYELNYGFNKMTTEIKELNNVLDLMEGTEDNLKREEIEQVIEKIEQISILGNDINQNPIINKNVYYMCNQINYDNSELQKIIDAISENLKTEYAGTSIKTQIQTTELPVQSVEYRIYIQITEETDRAFSTIKIIDKIPKNLNVDTSTLKASSNFSTINLTEPSVEWSINKAGGGELQGFMMYTFESNTLVNKTWIENNIKTPYIIVESFSLGGTPLTSGIIGSINLIFSFFFSFSNYFIALALTGVVIIIFLRIIEMLILLIWNIIIGTSKKQDFSKIKRKWLGKANPKYMNYIILGVILLVFGIILTFIYPLKIQDSIIVLEKIGYNITTEPVGGLSSLLILFGIVSIYFSIEDIFKGSILKAGFYESADKIAKKNNLEDLKTLEKNMDTVQKKMINAIELRIDVSEEQELLYSIPISRIKELIKNKDQRTAKKVIEQSINRCEFSIGTIDKKIETANDIWRNWETKFDNLLNKKGEIRKEMLIDIPRTWRSWVLEKYLTKHLDKNLIIEGGILKKMEMKRVKKKGLTDILDSLIYDNKQIEKAAILRIDGKMIASVLDKGVNKSFISLMLSRMIKAVKIIETKAKTGKTDYLIAQTGNNLFFARVVGNLILFCTVESSTPLETLLKITNTSVNDLNKLEY